MALNSKMIKFHSQANLRFRKYSSVLGAVFDWFHCLMSNFGPCPMSLAGAFQKIVYTYSFTYYICPLLFILYMYFLENLTLNLTSNFGPCPMSLAAAFRNTTKIVTDKVINQSWGAIDDGMWWCYFGDGAMPSKIFVFSYARDCLILFFTLLQLDWSSCLLLFFTL